MRVIAGSARRLPLKAPFGLDTRPTQDRIKETLFNMLQTEITDCIFVDVFSGSGGIGIEALSRGAKKAYFMENHREAYEIIRENLAFTKLQDKAILKTQDALHSLKTLTEDNVDIIFMDPPYAIGLEKEALEQLQHVSYLDENSIIIVETSLDTEFPYLEDLGFEITTIKRYKTNQHIWMKKVKH